MISQVSGDLYVRSGEHHFKTLGTGYMPSSKGTISLIYVPNQSALIFFAFMGKCKTLLSIQREIFQSISWFLL